MSADRRHRSDEVTLLGHTYGVGDDGCWVIPEHRSPGADRSHLAAALDEIRRLRTHVETLHRLNGHSKQKGWWCSCGEIISRAHEPIDGHPAWSPNGRRAARRLHIEHVEAVLRGAS